MSRVYLVQWRPLDFSSAEQYGELVRIFDERDQMYDMDAATRRLLQRMPNFTDDDYIVAVGHPAAIAVVTSAAAQMNGGRFKLLVWHPDTRVYYTTQVDLGRVPDREVQV